MSQSVLAAQLYTIRDFTKTRADFAESHFGDHTRESAAAVGRRAGQAEVVVDHRDLATVPSQLPRSLGTRILPTRRFANRLLYTSPSPRD